MRYYVSFKRGCQEIWIWDMYGGNPKIVYFIGSLKDVNVNKNI